MPQKKKFCLQKAVQLPPEYICHNPGKWEFHSILNLTRDIFIKINRDYFIAFHMLSYIWGGQECN